MDASSNIVFKVSYGTDLRRFNARVLGGEMDLGINGLREKINSLFGFSHDAELMLTYIDEDGDIVTLVDDDDLCDVVRQRLNPIRISVKLNPEKDSKTSNTSSGSSQKKDPLQNLNDSITEVSKTLPKAAREALKLLSSAFTSKAPEVAPVAAEVINGFAKMGLSFRAQTPESRAAEGSSSGVATNGKEEKWKVPSEATKGKEKAAESTVAPPPALVDCRKSCSKKEKLKKDKFKSISGFCPNKKPHMPVRKLGGSYTVLPSGEPNPLKEGNGGKTGNLAPFGFYGYRGPIWSRPPFDLNQPAPGGPFSGVSYGSTSASSQIPSPMIHRGVQCDGCGSYPIVGPRYKSKVRTDYDLCAFCFPQIGNETEYTKMELPPVYPHPTPFWQMSDPLSKSFEAKSTALKLDSRFVVDVNITDGTTMAPLTPFTKTWHMKNNGTTVWPEGTSLLWIGGDKLSDQSSFEVAVPRGGLPVDHELHVSVDFTAPEIPGGYISYWRLVSPSGEKFGQRVWVLIQVDASVEGVEPEIFPMDLPPKTTTNVSSVVDETAKSPNPEPTLEGGGCTEPDNFNEKMAQLIKTLISSLPEDGQEPMLTKPSLVLDDLVSSVDMPAPRMPEPEPISEKLNLVSSATDESLEEPIAEPARASAPDDEERLLWELKQMGFDEVDVNREVLRRCGYDLERAVEELCGLSEWDPIVDELEEMGFHDTEMNKALLKKNGGSIKRVVMDLIAAGEEDDDDDDDDEN